MPMVVRRSPREVQRHPTALPGGGVAPGEQGLLPMQAKLLRSSSASYGAADIADGAGIAGHRNRQCMQRAGWHRGGRRRE